MLKMLAGLSMMALAAPAFGQKVYDANNTVIGPLVGTAGSGFSRAGPGLAILQLNGANHLLLVSALGVQRGFREIYWELMNCQGRAFLSYGASDILPLAHFDGQTIWAVDTRFPGTYPVKSHRPGPMACAAPPGASCPCLNFTPAATVQDIAPAVPTTVRFIGPISVR